jgi:hypothetical protein
MKVVVAYCQLHPKTVEAVWASADEMDEIVWADTSRSDDAYYDVLREHWSRGETFVVLEQDKVPAPFALRELHDCLEPWCTYPVPMAHNGLPCDFVSLSCTKFGAELMAHWPNLMDRVGEMNMGFGPKHWNRLDMCMANQVHRKSGPCHWHPADMVGHEHTPSRSLPK